MNNTVFTFDVPQNEPMCAYPPGSPERAGLKKEIDRQSSTEIEIPLIIGGQEVRTGKTGKVVMPCQHGRVLATYHKAGEHEVAQAIEAALRPAKTGNPSPGWSAHPSPSRPPICFRKSTAISSTRPRCSARERALSKPDAACEVIDYLRYNAYFASKIYADQPKSGFDQLNRIEYRPISRASSSP